MPPPHVQLAPVRLLGVALASVVFGLLPPLRALVFEQTLAWTAMIGSQSVHDVQGTYERQAQEAECY